MSQSYDREQQNDSRLDELYGKISALRNVTVDIHSHASDYSLIDSTTESMSSMLTSVKSSAARLSRAVVAGHPIVKMIGLALLAFFLLYTLYSFL